LQTFITYTAKTTPLRHTFADDWINSFGRILRLSLVIDMSYCSPACF